ncbi:GQ67_01301T0 [Komagataella phaffii]|nr:GQ67_01301T0 [Komagataella phaffii]AOA67921.1 GQ68_00089T0 [Komagataella phaffii GS115]
MYNHVNKQAISLRKDLASLEENVKGAPLSLVGQITTTMTLLTKSLDEYEDLIEKERNFEKKAKHDTRLRSFKRELQEYRDTFQSLRRKRDEAISSTTKQQLFDRRVSHHGASTAVSDNPYSGVVSRGVSHDNGPHEAEDMSMSEGLYKEKNTFSRGNQQLDHILEMAGASLDELIEQNEYIKRAQRKMTDTLETLGVSKVTIRRIEKKAFEDKWIFYGGAISVFVIFYLAVKYLR